MKKQKNLNYMLIKIVSLFILLISFAINSYAMSFGKRIEILENRFDLSSDVKVTTIIICLIILLIAISVIAFVIFLHKKIPAKISYILVTLSVVSICVISILFGDEVLEFCNEILEYQIGLLETQMIG